MSPRVTFGLPVYNGERTIRRCLDSVLSQEYKDFEVVVCDNASTDGTRDIINEYAERDPRVRAVFNEENIGQIENCNRVIRLAKGEYFRWIGVSDWIHPEYAARCVDALDSDPESVAVTTGFEIHFDDGTVVRDSYDGKRVESDEPHRRFARMLWFYHAGHDKYDPLYGMIRRAALEKTPLLRMMLKADWMLSAELSLIGRFQHIPQRVAFRFKPRVFSQKSDAARRSYHPKLHKKLKGSPWYLYRVLLSVVRSADLSWRPRLWCQLAALRFLYKESSLTLRIALRRLRRERLGLTRRNAQRLWRRIVGGNRGAARET